MQVHVFVDLLRSTEENILRSLLEYLCRKQSKWGVLCVYQSLHSLGWAVSLISFKNFAVGLELVVRVDRLVFIGDRF